MDTPGEASLLRCCTDGSVDDGKSTLIGRLLFDTRQVLADQLAHVEDESRRRGFDRAELALLTDGLRAEREQGITIDVAWRYFATARRKFVLADSPGHVEYTRNMVTGASTADVALVLVDARKGLVQQSRRHTFLSQLIGLRQLVVCVNKMDLVGYDAARFAEIVDAARAFAGLLGTATVHAVPIAALHGDNVAARSEHMPWYTGPSLLELLETLPVSALPAEGPLRFPVQWVVRPRSDAHHDYRGYAGQVASETLGPGDRVVVTPSGRPATIARVETFDGALGAAWPPMVPTVHLVEDLDVTRGDILASPSAPPAVGSELSANLCWMSRRPPRPRPTYLLKQATRTVPSLLEAVEHRYDVDTLELAARLLPQRVLVGPVAPRPQHPVVRGPIDPLGRKNHYGSHSPRGTEVAATLYSIVESAKLNGLEPRLYLRIAVRAGLRHEIVPLPHEAKAMLAAGKIDPADYDDHTEEIVNAALATAAAVARASPSPDDPADGHPTEAAALPSA